MWNKPALPPPLLGRPLTWMLLALALGVALAELLRPALALSLWLSLLSLAAALLCLLLPCVQRNLRLAAWLLCCVMLGFYLCAGQRAALEAWEIADGAPVTVEGRSSGAAEMLEEGRYRLKLQVETLNGQPHHCAPIYVYAEGTPPRSGSRLLVSGECFRPQPPGNAHAFAYSAYLQRQGIAASVSTYYSGSLSVLEAGAALSGAELGAWLRQGLNEAAKPLSTDQRALVLGVFLGDKSGLDYQMKNALGLTGMLHAFAVSGLHVGYIVLLALLLAGSGYQRRWRRLVLTGALLLVYITLTGASASILRAALMTLTLLLADVFTEQNDTVSSLSLAALLCLAIKPLWLFDAGFQLSYGAVLGMIIYRPHFLRLLQRWPRPLANSYAVTLAASLFTLPLICYYYWHISWLGWLLAPLVVAVTGAAVLLSFAATLLAIFLPPLAALLLQAAGWLMELLYRLAAAVASWPISASVSGAVSPWYVAAFIVALLALPLLKRWASLKRLTAALIILTLLFSVAPRLERSWRGPQLAEAVFLDVGQGDAAFIETVDGLAVLVDGGGSMVSGAVGQYTLLPYLKSRGVTELDIVISSHPDRDHADGLLTVLENLPVGALLYGDCWPDDELQEQLLAAAEANGAQLLAVSGGHSYQLGQYLQLHIYAPAAGRQASGDDNDSSLVCELSCGETDILFTGDAGGALLAALSRELDVEAEILKLPHHGSKSGYDEDFYAATGAETAIISVGAENSYGHPARSVIEYWQQHGQVYRTDQQGAITVYLFQDGYQIQTEYSNGV